MAQHVDEEIFLRERAHARRRLHVERLIGAIDRGGDEPDRADDDDPRKDAAHEGEMARMGRGNGVGQVFEPERPEGIARRRECRQRHQRGHAPRKMRFDEIPDERERCRRQARERLSLGQAFRSRQHFIGDDMTSHGSLAGGGE